MAGVGVNINLYDNASANLQTIYNSISMITSGLERMSGYIGSIPEPSVEMGDFQNDINSALASAQNLKSAMAGIGAPLNTNTELQQEFNREIQNGQNAASGLNNMISKAVGAFTGIQAVRKTAEFIKDSTEAYNIQSNAENQLKAVLGNMLDEDYVAQFQVAADTTAAIDEINSMQNSVDDVTVTVNARTDALESAFDAITAKASEIQLRGIYGDEAMIAGAAEFATYFSDPEAITTMMDTLSDYAMGMTGGGEVDTNSMVNYATNLGKIMTGSYDSMTKKGFEFTEAQKAIIEGEATREQIIDTLGADYADMSEDMQAAAAITQVIDESWAGLYESMSNTSEGKIIQMTNAWGDMQETIGGKLYPYVLLFVDTINENWGTIETIVNGITVALQFMLGILSLAFDVAVNIASLFQDNWEFISPLIYGVAAALAIYGVYLGVVKTAALAYSAAQWVMNSALFACPLTWIVLMIIAVVAAIYAVVIAINKLTGSTASAAGVVCGVFMMAAAFIGNLIIAVINAVIDVFVTFYNVIVDVANFIANVFVDPVGAIAHLFFDLADDVLGILQSLASAIDTVFGSNLASAVQGWRNSLGGWVDDTFGEEYEIMTKADIGDLHLKSFDYEDAFNAGYSFGENADDFLSEFSLDDFFGTTNLDGTYTADNIDEIVESAGATADNTSDIADALNTSDEDLKFLRDLAEREVINKFTTAEVTVEFGGITNNLNSDRDIDGFVNILTERVEEALSITAEGVHA